MVLKSNEVFNVNKNTGTSRLETIRTNVTDPIELRGLSGVLSENKTKASAGPYRIMNQPGEYIIQIFGIFSETKFIKKHPCLKKWRKRDGKKPT